MGVCDCDVASTSSAPPQQRLLFVHIAEQEQSLKAQIDNKTSQSENLMRTNSITQAQIARGSLQPLELKNRQYTLAPKGERIKSTFTLEKAAGHYLIGHCR
uniref:Uncharacterized protein n=1 Tax=Eutreptiella gymnastica TaxID=73025 RepID=A0A7S4D1K0_9EUGL